MSLRPGATSGITEVEPLPSRAGWGRLGAFVLLLLLALSVVIVASRRMVRPPPAPFDERTLGQLRRARPEFVLLGNSMVATRFDEDELRALMKPRRVAVLGLTGTASSGWYLALKNLVIASGSRPRVILFFREQELTKPRMWAEGKRVERLSLADEPVLESKLAPPWSEPMARFAWYRDRAVPLELLHQQTEPIIERVSELGARLLWRTEDTRTRKRAINDLFALRNLRVAEDSAEPAATTDASQVFAEVVKPSFLPNIIELARTNGIPLTFVRVRTRAAASGATKTASELRYDADLEGYLRAHGAEFYDLHDAAWETLDMYALGDHIGGRFIRQYTALFVEHMGQIFH